MGAALMADGEGSAEPPSVTVTVRRFDPPAAVLFDCDGVIVDSEPITAEVISANLTRHGYAVAASQIHALFQGRTMMDVEALATAEGATLPVDWMDEVYGEMFDRHRQGTPLVPGIVDLLDRLDDASIPYAIGSNGPTAKMHVTLGQHAGLLERFAGHLHSREDVTRPKPAPDVYLLGASELGVAPDRCVVVEDSEAGAAAAVAAGMRCLGYVPPANTTEALTSVGAEPFSHMEEVPALLGLDPD